MVSKYQGFLRSGMCSVSCMKIFMCVICFSLVLIGSLKTLNDIHAISDSENEERRPEETTVIRELHHYPEDSAELVEELRASLVKPTTRAYQVHLPVEEHVLERAVRQINRLKRGFFIEVGAWDGVYRSPTLCLEAEDGWSGLLIEPDPAAANRILKAQRKSVLSNSCVGSSNYSYMTYLYRQKAMPPEWAGPPASDLLSWSEIPEVRCYPLYTYILALGLNWVDFLVININGGELEVLKTFPWHLGIVKIVATAFRDQTSKSDIIIFMKGKGYLTYRTYEHQDEFFVISVLKDNNVRQTKETSHQMNELQAY